MSTPAQRAAVELLEAHALPVRTHERREPPLKVKYRRAGWRPKQDTLALHRNILALIAQGLKNFQIAEIVGVSRTAVGRHRSGRIKLTRVK